MFKKEQPKKTYFSARSKSGDRVCFDLRDVLFCIFFSTVEHPYTDGLAVQVGKTSNSMTFTFYDAEAKAFRAAWDTFTTNE